MSRRPVFRLVPIEDLRPHEEIRDGVVRELAERIRRAGAVDDPIWVAAQSMVILNGHHRVAALRELGAERAPAWVFAYDSDLIRLERWSDGPPIERTEVVARATRRELFAPKTTRHVLTIDLPHRSTPLARLIGPGTARRRPPRQRGTSARSAASRARASPGSE
jgi:L-serine kinase (ADP)